MGGLSGERQGGVMTRYLRAPYDRVTRWTLTVLVVAALVWTGHAVGVVHGRHRERMKAWRECQRQLDSWAGTYRIAPAGFADPCGGK